MTSSNLDYLFKGSVFKYHILRYLVLGLQEMNLGREHNSARNTH